ncbi:MAG: hypothetical protein R6X25_06960 [Candidatus Krumholzibacteriia bacterium]
MAIRDKNPASRESLRVYDSAPIQRQEHEEGTFTRVIEEQTAKMPSTVFLVASLSTMVISLGFAVTGRHGASRFVGMWAPALLTMGVYNKLAKIFGPR